MPLSDSESMVQLMLYSVIESAINKVLSLDSVSLNALSALNGKVVRIKTVAPYLSIYLVICDGCIQVFHQYDGPVDARIRAPASSLAWYVFGPAKEDSEHSDNLITVSGDRDLVDQLGEIAKQFNIWLSVQKLLGEWLPEYGSFEDIWQALKSRDPVWIERLQYLPQALNDAVIQLKRQADIQERQLQELTAIRVSLAAQQRFNSWMLFIGLLALLLAFLSATGFIRFHWLEEVPIEVWVFGSLGLGLVVPRLGAR